MDVLKNIIFPKINFKRAIICTKTYSCLVNSDWLLITGQVKQSLDYVNWGAVDGLLNECIRRYFFPFLAKGAKK